MCITFPIVGLRVYSRLKFSRRLFEDDWFALVSAVSSRLAIFYKPNAKYSQALLLPTSVIEILSGFAFHDKSSLQLNFNSCLQGVWPTSVEDTSGKAAQCY
jgi:hypothetical protein